MDELLNRLQNVYVSCYIGNMFLGGLGYADDYVCWPPSRGSISLMLIICDHFGAYFDVLFNSQNM